MTNQLKFSVNPEASASVHEGGIVILHIGQGRLYTCNRTGARIWRGIEQQLPLETIAEQISGECRIDGGAAREQALRFVADLERHALVQRRAA